MRIHVPSWHRVLIYARRIKRRCHAYIQTTKPGKKDVFNKFRSRNGRGYILTMPRESNMPVLFPILYRLSGFAIPCINHPASQISDKQRAYRHLSIHPHRRCITFVLHGVMPARCSNKRQGLLITCIKKSTFRECW